MAASEPFQNLNKILKRLRRTQSFLNIFCLFTEWLHVACNVAWMRNKFFFNERIENVASNINVKKVTHCVRNYEYPVKSPCQLCWSCKNLFRLAFTHSRKINRNYFVFHEKLKTFLKNGSNCLVKNAVKNGSNMFMGSSHCEVLFGALFPKFLNHHCTKNEVFH